MKTADGKFKLRDIVDLAIHTPGVVVEHGSRHPYVLKYQEAPVGNCALANSTSTDHHIVPWFKKVTGYDKKTIYNALKVGAWC